MGEKANLEPATVPAGAAPSVAQRAQGVSVDSGKRLADATAGKAAEAVVAASSAAVFGSAAAGKEAEGKEAEGKEAEGKEAEGKEAEGKEAENPSAESTEEDEDSPQP